MELRNIKEIIIKTKDNKLICSITEDNVIKNKDYVIEYISDEESVKYESQQIDTEIGANSYLEKNISWKPYDINFDIVLKAIGTVPKRLKKKEWELVKIAVDDRFSNMR